MKSVIRWFKTQKKVYLFRLTFINLYFDSVKILGIHFSYNKKIEIEGNFTKLIKKIENVLKIKIKD